MEQLMKSYMAIMAERDAAIRERNMALVEKKKALADRDMAILQRDAAISQRNSAILERNDAIDALQCRDSSMNGNNQIPDPPEHGMRHGAKHMHQQPQHMHHIPHFTDAAYSPREVPFSDDFPNSAVASETAVKPRKVRQTKQTKAASSKKSSKLPKRGKRGTKVLSKQVTIATFNGWKSGQDLGSGAEELNRQQLGDSETEWKDDLGLNNVNFDDATMPVPVCSCTGVLQPCYKWGNGGWQSACCTMTLSMYPLPQMPNKRHSRLGGRKMSGSAFAKLLSRLSAEGHDLSAPLDLKDHWAKHGTNRYITIK